MNLMEIVVMSYIVSVGFVIVTGQILTAGDGLFLATDYSNYVPASASGNISLLYNEAGEYNSSASEGLNNINNQNTGSENTFNNDLYNILYNGTVALFQMGATLLTAPLVMIDIFASFLAALFTASSGVVMSLALLAKSVFTIIALYVLVWNIILGRPS